MRLFDYISNQVYVALRQVYATIKEVSLTSITKTVCKSSTRERHVYISRTSAVEIRVVGTSSSTDEFFLLRYEGLDTVSTSFLVSSFAVIIAE